MREDSLGDTMKQYESVPKLFLMRKTPVIIRLDGKAFHSFTKGFDRPFDEIMIQSMWETAKYLCQNIQGCKIAYVQSDEISLLLTDYDDIKTEAWFGYNVEKMTSISASMATLAFNNSYTTIVNDKYNKLVESPSEEDKKNVESIDKKFNNYFKKINTALFDSRVANYPLHEVINYFIWRQQDATRNAIQMVGQANFSHSQLQGKNCNEIQEMLWQEKGINFNNLPTYQKRGACIVKQDTFIIDSVNGSTTRKKWWVDKDIPIFTQNRNYISQLVYLKGGLL